MTKTKHGYSDNGGKAYCVKCNSMVSQSQIKHEMGYAMIADVGHTLVCVCVECFNKRFAGKIETQPASEKHQYAFSLWMTCMFSLNEEGANRELILPLAEDQFISVARVFNVDVSNKGEGLRGI